MLASWLQLWRALCVQHFLEDFLKRDNISEKGGRDSRLYGPCSVPFLLRTMSRPVGEGCQQSSSA
jgi:hypothetical protein